jgi:Sulfite exporter TauE/SafE.
MELSVAAYLVLALTAFSVGAAKTGVPGLVIVAVVLVPLVLPAKLSTGYILPFLVFADIMAVLYWRKAALWKLILRVMPAMFLGIVAGYLLMGHVGDAMYSKVLGGIILFILLLDWVRRRFEVPFPVNSRIFAWGMGLLAGIMTMLANAAAPVTAIYLLAMGVTKKEFVGTSAWLFFFVNISKIPFSWDLGLTTPESLWVNLLLLPCVLLGGVAGIFAMRTISEETFNTLMRILAFAGGVKLFF